MSAIIVLSSDEETEKVENEMEIQPIVSILEDKKEEISKDCFTIDETELNGTNKVVNNNNSQCETSNNTPNGILESSNVIFEVMSQFLEMCRSSLVNSPYEEKILSKFESLKKRLKLCSENVRNSEGVKKVFVDNMEPASISASQAVIAFNAVYQFLKGINNDEAIEVNPEDIKKLKKCEKLIKLIQRKLKHLEESELDFTADENSSYIQYDRYCRRLDFIYKKYCAILKRNPYMGRSTHDKIAFTSSTHTEINRAITKMYNTKRKFPDYLDVEKCIKKCVEEHKLPLSSRDILNESEVCFRKLGEMLQIRRKKELYSMICQTLPEKSTDPAIQDSELNKLLDKNRTEGEERMNAILEKYAKQQDNYVEAPDDDKKTSSSESGDDS